MWNNSFLTRSNIQIFQFCPVFAKSWMNHIFCHNQAWLPVGSKCHLKRSCQTKWKKKDILLWPKEIHDQMSWTAAFAHFGQVRPNDDSMEVGVAPAHFIISSSNAGGDSWRYLSSLPNGSAQHLFLFLHKYISPNDWSFVLTLIQVFLVQSSVQKNQSRTYITESVLWEITYHITYHVDLQRKKYLDFIWE